MRFILETSVRMIRKGLTLSRRTSFPTYGSTAGYCKSSSVSTVEELRMKLEERGILATELQEFLLMNSSLLKHVKPQKIFSILETLFELHPCNSTCLGALPICPDLLASSPKSIEQSATCLRKHGLMEGDLQRVVQTLPWVLLVSPRQMGRCIDTLRFKCEFTKQQQVLLLRGSPDLVCMDPKDVLDVLQVIWSKALVTLTHFSRRPSPRFCFSPTMGCIPFSSWEQHARK
uniref:Uncharacterized protein n=1 Tax=Eptatretus burgeri TaxID=7764 RepID=A0A8C4PY20_EPTBU